MDKVNCNFNSRNKYEFVIKIKMGINVPLTVKGKYLENGGCDLFSF